MLRTYLIRILLSSILLFLAGCSTRTILTDNPLIGIDGVACAGEIITPPEGLIESSGINILKKALNRSGLGGLCAGKEFVAKKSVRVYRVWDSTKNNRIGEWWSFDEPNVSREQYRREEDICESWSSLDRLTVCTIVIESRIAVGPGQSAQCRATTYPKSSINQVYIPNNDGKIFVENCDEGTPWPR